MKRMPRLAWSVLSVVLLPLPAGAQGLPPVPPAPPAPVVAPARPAPAALPAPPAPVAPPMFDYAMPIKPLNIDQFELQEKMREAQEKISKLSEKDFELSEKMKLAAEKAAINFESSFTFKNDFNFAFAQGPMPIGPGPARVSSSDDNTYNNGVNMVMNRQYDRAIIQFERVIGQKSTRSDGALYWKAFSQARLVRTEDSLATLAELRKEHPQSRYLGDAKVLEADVKKLAGQKLDPQQLDANDEMKLYAINGIANTDPNTAIPLLENVLNQNNTLRNKQRALYVLALSDDPRAHQILLRYAKGAGNPELQAEAVKYLASRPNSPTRNQELREIYGSTQDAALRRAIINAYQSSGDKPALVEIVRGRTGPVELRGAAIRGLSNLAAPSELMALYQQETDTELKNQMISVFGSMNAVEQLTQIVKTEKDPAVRLNAVRRLGSQRTEQTGQLLADLYGGDQDREVRKAVISALSSQNNADGLVAIARKENDLELKRDIIKRLSDMAPKNKTAASFLMEVLK